MEPTTKSHIDNTVEGSGWSHHLCLPSERVCQTHRSLLTNQNYHHALSAKNPKLAPRSSARILHSRFWLWAITLRKNYRGRFAPLSTGNCIYLRDMSPAPPLDTAAAASLSLPACISTSAKWSGAARSRRQLCFRGNTTTRAGIPRCLY